MRCYLIKAPGCIRLGATGGEARAFRQAIVDERGVSKKKIALDPINLPTKKNLLLPFINALLEKFDDQEIEFPPLEGDAGEEEGDGEE
jgi:hypothetical protein